MRFTNFANWYWIIGGDQANVWSSARAMSVPVTDADYVAWQAAGGVASAAATKADVVAVCSVNYPPGTLESYCVYKRWVKEQGGITLSSGMPIATDDRSQAKINGVVIAGMGKTNFTTHWHAADGTFWPLDEAAITDMSAQLQAHINQCFAASQATMAGIADGSVTTLEQIDAAFGSILTRKG